MLGKVEYLASIKCLLGKEKRKGKGREDKEKEGMENTTQSRTSIFILTSFGSFYLVAMLHLNKLHRYIPSFSVYVSPCLISPPIESPKGGKKYFLI